MKIHAKLEGIPEESTMISSPSLTDMQKKKAERLAKIHFLYVKSQKLKQINRENAMAQLKGYQKKDNPKQST